jgi:hypothetical protein
MTERVFRFGANEGLLGVLTEPSPEAPRPENTAPAVLWLNAGVLHHVGPFGWYVTLARRLAGLGAINFRIDLSGIGESPVRDGGPTLERAILDVTEAMDFLTRKRQVRNFVLIGLCSGAVLAHHVAVRDERVAGVVQIDGCGYPTLGFYLRYYGARALRWRSWANAACRVVRRIGAVWVGKEERPPRLSESVFFDCPPRAQARADLEQLVKRGARLLFLYTGAFADQYFNHRRQFGEMFGHLGGDEEQIEVEYNAQADHLFAAHEHRAALFERVEKWLRRFPP